MSRRKRALPFFGESEEQWSVRAPWLSPRGGGKITAYKITVTTGCPSLSIVEFPVVADWEVVDEVVSAIRFVPG
jgi:hypothetical protein